MTHDNPKESIRNDLFRRVGFSSRIAQLIRNRASKESIVIGIDGPWGEGKTTVLNFVAEKLAEEYPKIVVIRFNPWMFADENKLLRMFFTTVTAELSKSLNAEQHQASGRQDLKNDLKEIAHLVSEYSDSLVDTLSDLNPVPGSGILGKFTKKILLQLTATDLEKRKTRMSELLSKYEKKVVVIIDDIDRLSKDEVYNIFRLVKLTADFDRFFYLLAYDGKRVAEAIGERFGTDKDAGNHFLEKIVQVPLNLPELFADDLTNLFFNSLNDVLVESQIEIQGQELKRFQDTFYVALQPKIDSPRKAIRYSNAIQFTLPLMKGEVNIVDAMLLEGVKVFYGDHYEVIKDNFKILTSTDKEHSKELVSELAKTLENIGNISSDRLEMIEPLKALLMELFPMLRGSWRNTFFPSEFYVKLNEEKRIASREYFNRYFTFSLGEHEISDNALNSLRQEMGTGATPAEVSTILRGLTNKENIGRLIQKLRVVERSFSARESELLSKGLSIIGEQFPKESGVLGFNLAPFSQAAMLISSLLTNVEVGKSRSILVGELLDLAQPFEFATEILKWIESRKATNPSLIESNALGVSRDRLRERGLKESGDIPIYVKFPDHSIDIINSWANSDRAVFSAYVKTMVKTSRDVLALLRHLVGKSFSNAYRGPLISDFYETDYKWLSDYVGSKWIYDILTATYGESFSKDVRLDTKFSDFQNEENVAKQFMHFHQKATGTKSNIKELESELPEHDIPIVKLNSETSEGVVTQSVIPFLVLIERQCKQFLQYFDDYERDIQATIGGTSVLIANKATEWTKIELDLTGAIQRSNKTLQMIDYSLSLKGNKKSLTIQYLRVDLKLQFNEYNFMIIFNSDYQHQRTFSYAVRISNEVMEEYVAGISGYLSAQMISAAPKKVNKSGFSNGEVI